MKNINIGITLENRQELIKLLNQVLADEFILYTKARNYHWNVVGARFSEMHKFFEEIYTEVDAIKDSVAERVRQLGGVAIGSLAEFLAQTQLSEHKGEVTEDKQMIESLLHDTESIICSLREKADLAEKYEDVGTNDFLIGIMQQHEKQAWMLRSFLA